MKRKYWILLLLCVLLCTGCRGKGDKAVKEEQPTEIVFSWWGNDSRHEYTIRAIRRFEKSHPKIKVSLKYSNWVGYSERIRMEMMSNTEADVMQINYPWLQEYSPDGNRFFDLYKDRGDINLVSFTEEEEEMGTIDGKLNALPISLNTPAFYWNQTLLSSHGLEVPATWEDLFAMAKVLSRENIYCISTEPQFVWFLCTAYAEQQSGHKLLGEEGELLFAQEDLALMMEFYQRLIDEGVLMPVDTFDKYDLAKQVTAGAVGWTNSAEAYCEEAVAEGFEMVVGKQLASSDAKRSGWYYKPTVLYAVSANTEHPKESVLLLNFLLNNREMTLEQKLEKGVPVSNAARKTLEENNLLTGLPYEAFLELDGAMERQEIELEHPNFEVTALVRTFTELALQAEDAVRAQSSAKQLYEYMKDQAYLDA